MKKVVCVFGFVLIFILSIIISFLPFYKKKNLNVEATTDSNFTNLIVFAKFKDEDEFLDDIYGETSVKQITENSYSLADYSVKDYYYRVSNGKLNMQNLYLFDNGGSLTLNNLRGYYCTNSTDNEIGYTSDEKAWRMAELRQDWGNAISTALNNNNIQNFDGTQTYSYTDLDKNNDGYIDNITIIYKYSTEFSVSWADCLWNYQSTSNYLELTENNKTIMSNSYVQITANYSSVYSTTENGMQFNNLKVMIHEMGHVFGLKDLYRTEEDNPVYYMSAMAKAISPIPQYISAKEREVLGWLDSENVKTIYAGGEYTINVTTSDSPSGVVCYKCDIPSLNKTLYMEYRSFEGTQNKYDTKNKVVYNKDGDLMKFITMESGLVCFLIDTGTNFPNNLYSSGSNWNYKVLGGQYKTKTDSALMLGESLQITTGLSVEVTSLNENNLTFVLTGTDIKTEHIHNLTKAEFKDSTCKETGNIEYYYCEDCEKYFLSDNTEITYLQTIITKKEHKPKLVAGKDSTCKETGLTDGYICEYCLKELVKQEEIAKKEHTESDWIIDKKATPTENGEKHKECTKCGEILETETIVYEGETTPPKEDIDTPNDNDNQIPESPTGNENKTENQTEKSFIIVGSVLAGAGVVAGIIIFIIKRRKL